MYYFLMDLKHLRKTIGWTIAQAAAFLGISVKTYSRYENDPSFRETSRYQSYLSKLSECSSVAAQKKDAIECSSDDFASLISSKAHYVDKTELIERLIENNDRRILFTRPRRFGKSLNMSMLRHFFDIEGDPSLFNGLYISSKKELCSLHQNQYPTIFVTLKDVSGKTVSSLYAQLSMALKVASRDYISLLDSPKVSEADKALLRNYMDGTASEDELNNALANLAMILYAHYERKIVVLIDEYDAPLLSAANNGYFGDAVSIIRTFFCGISKTNPIVDRAIFTGCLRISKESIFTGLNNITIDMVGDIPYAPYFGFTESEVRNSLTHFGLMDRYDDVKRYYDGYHFGRSTLYCPYNIMCFLRDMRFDEHGEMRFYWINSSENSILRVLLEKAGPGIRDDIERLIDGGFIEKALDFNVVYPRLYEKEDYLFSAMVSTGYLTLLSPASREKTRLCIPNEEVRYAFLTQIRDWTKERISAVAPIADDLLSGKPEEASEKVNSFLWKSIGIQDYSRRKDDMESFYHGLLLGMMHLDSPDSSIELLSNKEAGLGYLDIAIRDWNSKIAALIEIKVAPNPDFVSVYKAGKNQIRQRSYEAIFGPEFHVRTYIAIFHKKRCAFFPLTEE